MSELHSENEFRRRRAVIERLLFCLRPSDAERQATVVAGDYARREAGIVQPIRAQLLHATVAVLEDAESFREEMVSGYKMAGALVARRAGGPFRIDFSRASRNGQGFKPQPLVLACDKPPRQFRTMQKATVDVLAKLGLPPPRYGLKGLHTTLLYGHGGVNVRIPTVSWEARELILVLSLVGLSEHIVLEAWPLTTVPDLFDTWS